MEDKGLQLLCVLYLCISGNLALQKILLMELFLWNVVSFRNITLWLYFYIGSKKRQTGSVGLLSPTNLILVP